MKKFFKLFVICLLALGLVACTTGNVTPNTPKELELAHLDQNKLGVYTDLNNNTAEVKESSVVFGGNEFSIYKSGDSYVIKYGETEAQVNVTFEEANVKIGDLGTFTLRKAATIKEDNQGIYVDPANLTSTVVVRSSSITLNNNEYNLYENETGLYYLSDGKENYVSFEMVLTVAGVKVGAKTYIITQAPLPVEDGELTKLIKSIIEKAQSQNRQDYGFDVNLSGSLKETVLAGAKPESIFDLFSDINASATATIDVKNLDVTDLTKLLAAIVVSGNAKIMGEEGEFSAQINVQDGKAYLKQCMNNNPDTKEVLIKELPSLDDLVSEIVPLPSESLSGLDLNALLAQIAQYEAQLAQLGIKFEDIQKIVSKLLEISEDGIKIHITKEDARACLAAIRILLTSKLDVALTFAWDNAMGQEEKSKYQNSYETFKNSVAKEISDKLDEVEEILKGITINSCKFEFNANTLATLVDIDVVMPGAKTEEDDKGQEKVIYTYENAIKLLLNVTPREANAIEKVNPEDYIIKQSDIQALITKYLNGFTLPELSSEVEFKKRINFDEETGVNLNIEMEGLTKAETDAIKAEIIRFSNNDEMFSDQYMGRTIITNEFIINIMYNGSSEKEDNAMLEDPLPESELRYKVSLYISVAPNDLPYIVPIIDEGITAEFEFQSDGKAWQVYGYVTGKLNWEDANKVVYIKDTEGNILHIARYNNDYNLSLSIRESGNISFTLGEDDPTLIPINVFSSDYRVKCIASTGFAKAGQKIKVYIIANERYEIEDDLKFDLYVKGEVLQSNLAVGAIVEYTMPETNESIDFSLRESRSVSE